MACSEGVLTRLFGLEGQVAVVAGGAGRIGSVLSSALAEAGAKLCILDLADEAAAALAGRLAAAGRSAIAVRADAGQKAELESALAEITARLGPPTILVNSTRPAGRGLRPRVLCPDAAGQNGQGRRLRRRRAVHGRAGVGVHDRLRGHRGRRMDRLVISLSDSLVVCHALSGRNLRHG